MEVIKVKIKLGERNTKPAQLSPVLILMETETDCNPMSIEAGNETNAADY
jgi:hypothetical protein